MVNRVPVKAELLEWAYHRSMRQEYLNEKFSKLTNWLKGELQPTFRQLEEFAKATSTPLGYFFLEQPPVEEIPIPHYRTVEQAGSMSQASPDLLETLHTMQRRQDFMRDYYDKYVGEPLSYVGSYSGTSVKELVSKLKKFLNINNDWARNKRSYQGALNYLIAQCEKQRIMVMVNGIVGFNTHRTLDVQEFRGFVLVDNMAPLIFINGADAKSAQIFTLIHEVAHLIIGSSAIVEASPLNEVDASIEQLCNRAAAELLCPENNLRQDWHTHYGDEGVYQTLADNFKVSPIVIARRALELNLISRYEFIAFYEDYRKGIPKNIGSSKPGGDFYYTTRVRLGNLFSKIILSETRSGELQYTDAHSLTGLKRSTFDKYMNFIEERGV